jgi:hypothetical protein
MKMSDESLIVRIIVFLFNDIFPVLWSGHDLIAQEVADRLGHPEVARGLANMSWLFTTVLAYYVFTVVIKSLQWAIKIILFLMSLLLVSLAFYGVVAVFGGA